MTNDYESSESLRKKCHTLSQERPQSTVQLSQVELKRVEPVLQWSSEFSAIDVNDSTSYLPTQGYLCALKKTLTVRGGLFAIIGMQGVGKSAALHHLYYFHNSLRKKPVLLINWSDPSEQIRDLLRYDYGISASRTSHPFMSLREEFEKNYRVLLHADVTRNRMVPIKLPKGATIPDDLRGLDVDWVERKLGRSKCAAMREQSWFMAIRSANVVLIDLPDYARTDRRLMTRDLNQIYRLWKWQHAYSYPPTIVIAIQKEMIHGHFFFDKMEKIAIQPLTPQEMPKSYVETFGNTYPFDEVALLALAGLSRGIYRRFKRYISLSIEKWQAQQIPPENISPAFVETAITAEQLAEDLETELEELFPKNIESRRDAARIIHHLRSSGPTDQTKLGETLEIPPYTLSRLLSKMDQRYVIRKTDGSRKIVNIRENET